MRQTATVELGEREYQVKELAFKRSRVWRKQFMDKLKPIFDQVSGIQEIEFNTPEDLLTLFPLAQTLLVDSVDIVAELLFLYSPELETDREYIEDNATDREIIAAFRGVLELADFFGILPAIERRIGPGMNTT